MPEPAARDCLRCKSPLAMKPGKAPTTPWVLRAIGYVLLLPTASLIGWGAFAVLWLLIAWARADPSLDFFGSPYGNAMELAFGTILIVLGLVIGLIAWRFLARRRVYKCAHCGSVMNRASQRYARA